MYLDWYTFCYREGVVFWVDTGGGAALPDGQYGVVFLGLQYVLCILSYKILHVYHTCAVAGFFAVTCCCTFTVTVCFVYFVVHILHVYHTRAVTGFLPLHVALYVTESLVLLCICNTHVVYFVLALVCIFPLGSRYVLVLGMR